MEDTKTIIFVPLTSDLLMYNLTESQLTTLLNSLNGDFKKVEPDLEIYQVNTDNVAEIYSTLFTQKAIIPAT